MKALTSLKKSVSVFTTTLSYLQQAKAPDADVEALKQQWALDLLNNIKVSVQSFGHPSTQSSMLFVGNHISYLDIPILTLMAPKISFVSKKEIASWPIIGMGAKKINTIFVERNNQTDRKAVRRTISKALKEGARIVVFPSGTTSVDESTDWKRGAFEIAQDLNIPIQPFRLRYTPLRLAAYINRDFFPYHLFQLAHAGGARARIEFHQPVKVTNAADSCYYWQQWTTQWVAPPELEAGIWHQEVAPA